MKGATLKLLDTGLFDVISIHAPMKGATPQRRTRLPVRFVFQSTHP